MLIVADESVEPLIEVPGGGSCGAPFQNVCWIGEAVKEDFINIFASFFSFSTVCRSFLLGVRRRGSGTAIVGGKAGLVG